MDKGSQYPALILNADFQPLSYYPLSLLGWQEVVRLTYTNKVDVVAEYDKVIRSPSTELRLPSVVAVKGYVDIGRMKVAFNRFNVYLRDVFTCQYCGREFPQNKLTFDHVVPRSKGGKTEWGNIVAACEPCNSKKKDRLPEEIGMHPIRQPEKPSPYELKAMGQKFPPKYLHDSWLPYLDYKKKVA